MATLLETIAAWPGTAWQAVSGFGRKAGRTMAGMVGKNLKPVWPPEAEAKRLRLYEAHEDLYEGKQQAYFKGIGFKQANTSRPYICVNLLGGMTDLLATRAYGEPFEVAGPSEDEATQAFLQQVMTDNRLQMEAYDQCVKGIRNGDTAYKVAYNAEAQALTVQALKPNIVFPEWDTLNEEKLVAANIDQVLRHGDREFYLWRERHEMRGEESWVLNKLFRLDYNGADDANRVYYFDPAEDEVELATLEATASLPPETPTGIDTLLVVFQRGDTAYTEALLSLQGEYNQLVTQKSHLFDKHLPAIMAGPPPADDQRDEEGAVDLDQTRYFAVDIDGSMPVTLLEWSASGFAAADAHLQGIMQGFAFTAGVDVAALLPDAATAAASGTALRRQQMKTQGTVLGLQRHDEPTLQAVLSVCCKLGATHPVAAVEAPPTPLEVSDITITFGDGLPPDRTEQVAEAVQLVGAGIQSKADANKALFGGTDEDAQERVGEAEAEQQASRPPSPFAGVTGGAGATAGRFAAVTPGAEGGAGAAQE